MEETSTTPPSKLNLSKVLSESNQIIKLQSRNFNFLAVVFLLPPSIAAIVYLMFQYPLLNDAVSNYIINIITNSFSPDQEHIPNRIPTSKTLLLPLIAYALFVFLSSLCAVGSITYTTFHGFHGQPIKLKSAIISITTSFFPLLGTTLLIYTIVFAIILLFALVLFSAVNGTRSLGFDTEVFSPYFLVFSVAMAILFMFVLAYLHVNWALASAVVVVESTWGFESLKRSAILIKGRRGILLSLSYFLGLPQILFVWITCHSSLIMRLDGTATDELKPLFFNLAAQVLMTSIYLALFQLLSMAAITVLYVHCKATHDGEEFPGEYVGVPVEDEEVGRVVYVNSASKVRGPLMIILTNLFLILIFTLL